jgi:ubiquitin C-terminal hydrolase
MTKESSTVKEIFWVLSVNTESTLRESLKTFRRTERITGDNVWLSPKCIKQQVTPLYTTKRIDVGSWPQGSVYFHFKRFCWQTMSKDVTEVSVPMRILNDSMSLVAVIIHKGSRFDGGHYVCCVCSHKGNWYVCDDEEVTPVPGADVQRIYVPQAYIVAYA